VTIKFADDDNDDDDDDDDDDDAVTAADDDDNDDVGSNAGNTRCTQYYLYLRLTLYTLYNR